MRWTLAGFAVGMAGFTLYMYLRGIKLILIWFIKQLEVCMCRKQFTLIDLEIGVTGMTIGERANMIGDVNSPTPSFILHVVA